jgi:hypothetical protein
MESKEAFVKIVRNSKKKQQLGNTKKEEDKCNAEKCRYKSKWFNNKAGSPLPRRHQPTGGG